RPVMAELHLHRLRPGGEPEQLVPEADAELRDADLDELPDRLDRVRARLRVSGAVRQENAVRVELERLLGRRRRGHDRDPAIVVREEPQDIALHAEVVRDDVEARDTLRVDDRTLRPDAALVPLIDLP